MSAIDTAVRGSRLLEGLLEAEFGATGKGLHERLDSVEGGLPSDVVKAMRRIATIRNRAVHEEGYELDDPEGFGRSVEEVAAKLRALAAARPASTHSPAVSPRASAAFEVERDGLVVRAGVASGVRITAGVALLKVAGKPASITAQGGALVDNGERVLIAGRLKGGVLQGLAYANLSNGATGALGPTALFTILGVVFMIVAPAFIVTVMTAVFGHSSVVLGVLLGLAFGSIFFFVGLSVFKQGASVRRAQRLLGDPAVLREARG